MLKPEQCKEAATRLAKIGVIMKMATSNFPMGIYLVSLWYLSYFFMTRVVGIQMKSVISIGMKNSYIT